MRFHVTYTEADPQKVPKSDPKSDPEMDLKAALCGPLPGMILCLVVAGAALALEALERAIFSKAWIEALVLAILLGIGVRALSHRPEPQGVAFTAKYPLEIAVVLLGASVSPAMAMAAGPWLLLGIAIAVASAILISFLIGRALRLPARMALLVACGNSICGNSAIAAVAPVIGADAEEVSAAIAFTAVLGVTVVLVLPLLGLLLGLKAAAYGAFAGLTVYAVPQVIAAAAPMGATAIQMGTLVKLARVLMLGPVCIVLAVLTPQKADAARQGHASPPLHHFVPWFVLGFLAMMALRGFGLIPPAALAPIGRTASLLTVVSMAALGLGTDLRSLARAGGRVTAAVVLSLLALGAISYGLLKLLGKA